jgi:hypothetical protein
LARATRALPSHPTQLHPMARVHPAFICAAVSLVGRGPASARSANENPFIDRPGGDRARGRQRSCSHEQRLQERASSVVCADVGYQAPHENRAQLDGVPVAAVRPIINNFAGKSEWHRMVAWRFPPWMHNKLENSRAAESCLWACDGAMTTIVAPIAAAADARKTAYVFMLPNRCVNARDEELHFPYCPWFSFRSSFLSGDAS